MPLGEISPLWKAYSLHRKLGEFGGTLFAVNPEPSRAPEMARKV